MINEGLVSAVTWFKENKLTVNTSKTKYMVFGTKHRITNKDPITIKLGDQVLQEADTYKYLGTTLDPTLSGNCQLSRINQQIGLKLNSFRKIRRSMSERTAIIIYKATILPIFDYNDIIYHLLTKQQQTKLQRLQNRALRMIFYGRSLSVCEMHTRANIQTLDSRREAHLLALMYNRSFEPEYVDNTVRATRSADATMLQVPKAKLSKYTNAPVITGSIKWNDLPPGIRQAKSKFGFKILFKIHRAGLPPNGNSRPDRPNSD